MNKEQWIWMPHAAHFICGRDCEFHLATWIPCEAVESGVIVSTVGDYWPDSRVREVYAQLRDVKINGMGDAWDADYMDKIGYSEIGANRLFETMVFKARCLEDSCCPFVMADTTELDMQGYNDPAEAFQGHNIMCEKWSRMKELN